MNHWPISFPMLISPLGQIDMIPTGPWFIFATNSGLVISSTVVPWGKR